LILIRVVFLFESLGLFLLVILDYYFALTSFRLKSFFVYVNRDWFFIRGIFLFKLLGLFLLDFFRLLSFCTYIFSIEVFLCLCW